MKPNNVISVLKSLSDETRLSIVRKLAQENDEIISSEIVTDCSAALKLSQPTMSHHFNRLVNAGVLQERKVGIEKYYRLNHELLNTIGIDPTKL